MKRKFSAGLKFVCAVIAGLLFCYLLYFLVDRVFNGSFLDWFSRNYMITRITYLNEAGLTINIVTVQSHRGYK